MSTDAPSGVGKDEEFKEQMSKSAAGAVYKQLSPPLGKKIPARA